MQTASPTDLEAYLTPVRGLSGEELDLDYIATRAVRLEREATDLWFELLKRARDNVAQSR